MSNRISARVIDFCITNYCTLNCKLCIVGIPYIKERYSISPEELDWQLHEIFKIWDSAVRLNLVGGEALLHPRLFDIVKISLQYQRYFQSMRITTNGTIMPNDRLLELIADCGVPFDFVISDYGPLSKNLTCLTNRLAWYGIPYRVDTYVGDLQYYGGWVDLGSCEYMDSASESAEQKYQECCQVKTKFLSVYQGKVLQCVRAHHFLAVRGDLPAEGEYIDLYDKNLSVSEKRKTASAFFMRPTKTCRFCCGFNEKKATRYPAAEQLKRE